MRLSCQRYFKMNKSIDEMDIKESFYYFLEFHQQEEDFANPEDWKEYKEEHPNTEVVYKKARYGITLEFDLYDYINGAVNDSKMKNGIIIVRGESFDMSEFWTELERRTKILKKWLKEYAEPDGIARSY